MWRWSVVLVCGGCPPEPSVPACTVAFALGDGSSPFRARSDGDEAVIVHGPQGGYHLEVSVRASGTATPWTVDLTVTDVESDVRVSEQVYHLMPDPVDACSSELTRLLAILDVHELDPGTPADVLDGRAVRLEAVITDDLGDVYRSEVTVTALADGNG